MAAIFEREPELLEVIYLAVEDNADIARFVVNRLPATGKINDAQPAHSKDCSVASEHSLGVWTTVSKRFHHPANTPLLHRAVRADYATNAAHGFISPIDGCGVSSPAGYCY